LVRDCHPVHNLVRIINIIIHLLLLFFPALVALIGVDTWPSHLLSSCLTAWIGGYSESLASETLIKNKQTKSVPKPKRTTPLDIAIGG